MIKETIEKEILSNLKAGKKTDVKVLRFVLSLIQYAEIDKQEELTDREIVSLFQKEIKKRKEALELFKKSKRDDLIKDEEYQLKVIAGYLPKQMSKEELEKTIDRVLKTVDDSVNVGKVIGLVMAEVKGKADGSTVAALVREKLIPVPESPTLKHGEE